MRVVLTADWHLRGDAPACRKNPERWLDEQAAAVRSVRHICDSRMVDELWIVGDLFHRARTSTEATVQALTLLNEFHLPIRVLVGNHDELHHQYENVAKSTIGTVFSLEHIHELKSCSLAPTKVEAYPFGTEPAQIPSCDLWCTHQLVFPNEASRPLPELGALAEDLLQRSDAKVVITGDYHHGSLLQFGDRKVITCGCLTIQARDMADYQPRVYILDTETFDVEEVMLEQVGDLDLEAPVLEDANGYAETLHMAQLPRIDFRAAIEAAAHKAEPAVRDKVQEILDDYDDSKIA